ncbi:MAG TPA: hypothetical protein VI583_18000, partial [Cyclobacteriaceae bacterium]|nr:hypothetical protein [Cyclobacteriaceae bacterium]
MTLKFILFFSILILISAGINTVQAQNALLTPEKLWELGRITDPQVSPDGKWILYGATWYQLDSNKGKRSLYMTSIATGETILFDKIEDSAHNARWRPDGKRIGYLSDHSGTMQLWEMDIADKQPVRVTFFDMPIHNFSYSPDMKHIAFTIDVEIKKENDLLTGLPKADAMIIDDLMYRHWDKWEDSRYQHVCIAGYADGKIQASFRDIMENEKFDCPTQPFGGPEDITWNPDGSSILYVCKKFTGKEYAMNTNSDIYLYDLSTGKTVNLTDAYEGYDLLPSSSRDGRKIAWLNMPKPGYESDQREIRIYDVETGDDKILTGDFDRDISALCWGSDDRSIYFIASHDGTEQVFKIDPISPDFHRIS